jgi:Uncharacterized protein conserved in bacteria (DUF2059)
MFDTGFVPLTRIASALAAGLVIGGPGHAQSAATGGVAPDPADLVEALQLSEVFAIMEDEGIAYGAEIEETMFPGTGGVSWADTVREIYASDRVLDSFVAVFQAELVAQGADIAPMIAFFASDTGRKAIGLEVSARRAMLDPAVEDATKLKLADMREDRDPRLDSLEAFVTANDLVEANVTGGLNASLAFYRGLASAGAMGADMTEDDMLQDVWAQEPQIRADTEEWVYSFLALAYAPLSEDELGAYTAFSETEAGQTLNKALFAGFDVVFTDVSERLGTAAAGYIAGQDL